MGKDSAEETVRKIDEKMGEGWARRFANVLAADMTLKVEVTFVFEKFDSAGNFKYQSRRSA